VLVILSPPNDVEFGQEIGRTGEDVSDDQTETSDEVTRGITIDDDVEWHQDDKDESSDVDDNSQVGGFVEGVGVDSTSEEGGDDANQDQERVECDEDIEEDDVGAAVIAVDVVGVLVGGREDDIGGGSVDGREENEKGEFEQQNHRNGEQEIRDRKDADSKLLNRAKQKEGSRGLDNDRSKEGTKADAQEPNRCVANSGSGRLWRYQEHDCHHENGADHAHSAEQW